MTLYEISALICATSSVAFAAGVWRAILISQKDTSEIPPIAPGQQRPLPVPGQQFYLGEIPEPVTVTSIQGMDKDPFICYTTSSGYHTEISAQVFMSMVHKPPEKRKAIPVVGHKYHLKGVSDMVEIVDTRWYASSQVWYVWYCVGSNPIQCHVNWHDFQTHIENDCTY